jgi:hypothetical protein
LRELEAFIQRSESVLGGASDLSELVASQKTRPIGDRIRRVVRRRRERYGTDAVCEERRLFVQRVRKTEIDELGQEPWAPRPASRLCKRACRDGLEHRSGRRAWDVSVEQQSEATGAADGVEVDDRGDVVAQR